MQIDATPLSGLMVLTPRVFADPRGAFCETWNAATLAAHGIDMAFVQDNQSLSRRTGTLRGLHYQAPPRAQDKLVRVVAGAILDVCVDMRPGSATCGHWHGVEISAENGCQVLVPKGFLHGFVTRQPDTVVIYKTTDTYAPDCDGAVHFADPDLAIDWGIAPADVVLSDKDAAAPRLADWINPFGALP
jgi:dTDP-4-dehydrorhamnose 3,5-epimerase